LPGLAIISQVIRSAVKKPIFGCLGMVYSAPLRLLFRCGFSHVHQNPFLCKEVWSLPEVVTNQGRGKASGDS